jgi:uncharacterized membrane protein
MSVRFVLYGLLGWCGEIVWTAARETLTGAASGWRLRGTTYLWMFPIYGLLAPLYEPVSHMIRGWPWLARGALYMTGFFTIEYASGWLLRRLTGGCPWDYSSHSKWHVHGLVRLDYAPVWFLVGLALEPVKEFLQRLTPAIHTALR